jgi:hypothetical protein
LASVGQPWAMQPDATGSPCMPLVVGYTWMDSGSERGCLPRSRRAVPGILWDGERASGIAQGGVYPGVGGVLAVIEALGVDAQQDFHAVPGPLGDPWRGHPAASHRDTAACRRS